VVYAACFLLIPVKYAVIAARSIIIAPTSGLLKVNPLLILGLYCWAAGEFIAYLRPAPRP
jgi:hypothetical protein